MHKTRLEAFSDAVIAILMTIMVLELKVPHGADWEAIKPLLPVFLGYVLSFLYLGIYWNNHHHMLQIVRHVNGPVLWANSHLMFWLSLIPFTTGWLGENYRAPSPNFAYGFVLLMSAVAYTMLQATLIRAEGDASKLREAVGRDWKGKLSLALYTFGIAAAFVVPFASIALYVVVALLWLVPDRRIEDKKHLIGGH